MSSSDLPFIGSAADLYAFADTWIRGEINRYEHLAREMRRTHNPETAELFDGLATAERGRVSGIRKLSESENPGPGEEDGRWNEYFSKGARAGEIADNLYLMTPYRALRYAVYNEERLFDLLSAIAAEAEDAAVRDQAERMARVELDHIAELRLMRRRAYRAEVVTAIVRAGLARRSLDLQAFLAARAAINEVLAPLIDGILRRWSADLPRETLATLKTILNDLRTDLEARNQSAPSKEGVVPPVQEALSVQEADGPFGALKVLLRELEASFGLLMDMAETSQSEAVVSACQAAAEEFVRYLALVQEQLGHLNRSQGVTI